MSYFPSISQNVTVDTNNSEAGATIVTYVNPADIWHYNNLGTSTLGVNAIQIVVTSNKNLTIYVDQGNANNSFQITDTYNYLTTKQFGITVQAVGAYVRVRAKNTTGASATATIDTVLCPIVEALPRSLDASGNLQVALKSISDGYGFDVENTPQGEMRTIIPTRLVGVSFEGSTLDTNFWTTILQNGGTITQANGRLDILTNTTANGSATIFSNRRARYVAGNANVCRIQGRLGDTGTADNVRQWGAGLGTNYTLTITSAALVAGDTYTDISGVTYTILVTETTTTAKVFANGTPTAGARTYTRVTGTGTASLSGTGFATSAILTDGYCFQLSGTTFSVVTSIGGSPTTVDSGSFNGDVGATYVPTTDVVTWEIYYNTRTVWFVVNGVVLHTASNAATPLTNTQSLHVFLKNTNSNNSVTNVGLYTRSASIKRLGPLLTQPTSKYQSGTTAATGVICKYGAGNLHQVLVGGVASNGSVMTLYDGLSNNAPVIFSGTFQANTNWSWDFKGTPFINGLTLVIATQNANVLVIYE